VVFEEGETEKKRNYFYNIVTNYYIKKGKRKMVRYRRNIRSGVVRIPQEVREAFGDEIEMAPNLRSMAVYPANEEKRKVIRSLQLIIKDLKQEIEEEKEACK